MVLNRITVFCSFLLIFILFLACEKESIGASISNKLEKESKTKDCNEENPYSKFVEHVLNLTDVLTFSEIDNLSKLNWSLARNGEYSELLESSFCKTSPDICRTLENTHYIWCDLYESIDLFDSQQEILLQDALSCYLKSNSDIRFSLQGYNNCMTSLMMELTIMLKSAKLYCDNYANSDLSNTISNFFLSLKRIRIDC